MVRMLTLVVIFALAVPASVLSAHDRRFCWPGFTIPAVTIPAVTIPAVTIPAVTVPRTCIAGTCYPARHFPAQYLPAQHLAAQHLPAQHVAAICLRTSANFAPAKTTVRISHYRSIDPAFAAKLSTTYWNTAGTTVSYPNVYAEGFGSLNAAGFPKDQYVRPYLRRNGTFVAGYWRNSPTDGLPTCRIIHC
jgi:hypothetical protein